jgi:two-component system LytT family sensor kinase
MISRENPSSGYKKVFKVSAGVIWLSSVMMGILASIPKILQLNITFTELVIDSSIAFIYSLSVWYFNIFNLPKFSHQQVNNNIFNRRLLWSLLLGVLLMTLLVSGHQLFFDKYKFSTMIMMYQFRGILINLTIYMFLNLLYQSHRSQLMGIELERTKADNLGAQFELLKQQVNPHFLFNSLSTLKSMIEIGDEHSADFTHKLSEFYRFTLENRKSDLISLEEEIAILESYMYLLKARFEDGITLNIDIQSSLYQSLIPPFTLQLLVENCIKHNIVSLEQPLGIRLYITEDNLVIANKLQLKKNPEPSTQLGLENINQRFIHLLNKKIEIDNDGVSFKVKLPLTHEYPNH